MTRPTFITAVALLSITRIAEPPVRGILWMTVWGVALAVWGRMGW